MITRDETLDLAMTHGIAPQRCPQCRRRPETGLSWRYGQDDGSSPRSIGYQCQSCGFPHTMSRAQILRRIRNDCDRNDCGVDRPEW